MTTKFAAEARIERGPDFEVLPDPPKKRDMLQEPDATYARGAARARLEKMRRTAVVRAEGYLRASVRRRSPLDWMFYPDLMVAFGVDARLIDDRNGFVIEDHDKPPELVMEIASETTGRRDVEKRAGYASLRVPEYFMFDRTGGQYHGAPVWGGRLADGQYEAVPVYTDEDGVHSVYSETLGLDVCWVEGTLRFRDPSSGEYLHTHAEAVNAAELERLLRRSAEERAEFAEERAEFAEERAEFAERSLEREREARQVAESSLERETKARQAAQAEIETLRKRIRKLREED